jgi:hypothetical protein
MITYLGALTIGGTFPAVVAAINGVLPHLQAQVTALASFTATVTPPSFNADLQLAGEILANIEASISLGLTPPSIALQLSLVAAALAALEAQLNALLALPFGTAGIHMYHVDNQASLLGADITAQLAGGFPGGGPTDPAHALLIATTVGATWTAMQATFKTTP